MPRRKMGNRLGKNREFLRRAREQITAVSGSDATFGEDKTMADMSIAQSVSTQVRPDFVRIWRAKIGQVLGSRFRTRPLAQEDLEKMLRAQIETEAGRRRVDQLLKRI